MGWIVAVRMPSGGWYADTLGMWPSPEEAEQDKADAERAGTREPGERMFVCSVTPLEDGQDE